MTAKSALEEQLAYQIRLTGLPDPVREYKFHPDRRFRTDFAWPSKKLLVEVEGGIWMKKGRHTSGKGYESDCTKYNEATLLGYRVLRFTGNMVKSGTAITQIEEALRAIGAMA